MRLWLAAFALALAAAEAEPLAFRIDEGLNINTFVRDGPVAAHVVLRSGTDPRLIVVFPAGNSGTGLWFSHQSSAAHWGLAAPPRPVTMTDAKGRPLYGVSFAATIDAPQLTVKKAVLSNVRVLRDYQSLATVPADVETPMLAGEHTVVWQRDRLDDAPGYQLRLAISEGAIHGGQIDAGPDGHIRLTVTALSGDAPLQPLDGEHLLKPSAAPDMRARQALSFLSYREKYLAGSWRFNTYFGRDTLLSLRLLMPVLQPEAVADGIASVLARLSPDGQVAHEEDIGEFAILDHQRTDHSTSDAPVYDYKMVDETLLLAPVAEAWLTGDGRDRAKAFLAGDGHGAALARNFRQVLREAEPFAHQPTAVHLIGLKPGVPVGDWRDSEDGLGGGRYPYDVNAVLMPAALDAISRLYSSGLLAPYLTTADREGFAAASEMARVWHAKAPALFTLQIGANDARRRIVAYAEEMGITASTMPQAPVTLDALALDANGKPIPVLNSDSGFALLFAEPDVATLERILTETLSPFPLGLMTDAGLLVANPVFADAALRKRFSRNAYHGAVIWSWQQALFAAGLARQLQRTDLPARLRTQIIAAQAQLWRVIARTHAFANSELWSWRFQNGRYEPVPFGARGADADESDAVQLWSTVYLAVHP